MLPFAEVENALRGGLRTVRKGRAGVFRAVANDSRALQPGDLFFALRGDGRDGHEFVADALAKGAAGVVVERDAGAPEGVAVFVVRDTWHALGDLAAWWRAQFDVRVVAIAGNVGKTTTKELTAAVLGGRYRTLKSPANFNDEVGVSMTLFQLDRQHERAVMELGMYTLGEIRRLAEISRPQVGVVTNVGPTHLERVGTMEALTRAKSELPESLPAGGFAILNGDDPAVRGMVSITKANVLLFGESTDCDVRGSDVAGRGLEGIDFTLTYRGESVRARSTLPGRRLLPNALAAATVALVDGFSLAETASALAKAESPVRWRILRGRNGSTIIDDTYNASPASMLAALDLLAEMPARRIAVLGDMRELGPEESRGHRLVGERAAEVADEIHAIGRLGRLIGEAALAAGHTNVSLWDDKAAAEAEIAKGLRKGDSVLLKASHALALETMVPALQKED